MPNATGIDLPSLDPVLLKKLDEKYPERCPNPAWDERKIWMEAGKREVVRYLLDQMERQRRHSLDNFDV